MSDKCILVTGANGFIGRNLVVELKNRGFENILKCDIDTTAEQLDMYCKACDVVVHLAGVNRPTNVAEFAVGNVGFTESIIARLEANRKRTKFIITSSIQAGLDNPYGISKRDGENAVREYCKSTGADGCIVRLANVFGKWCRPNYNSVVATFCNNIANNLPIKIDNSDAELKLCYIDDVVNWLIFNIYNKCANDIEVYTTTIGDLADTIRCFNDTRKNFHLPNMNNDFVKKLYSTYLSYLPNLQYPLIVKGDNRGTFIEFLKNENIGQISVNTINPRCEKGGHWHHTKVEKFFVVSGEGEIEFTHIVTGEKISYSVSGEIPSVVDIPPGFEHTIKNTTDSIMVIIMWANEIYDDNYPDTYR